MNTRCSENMSKSDLQSSGVREKVLDKSSNDGGADDRKRDINDIFEDIALSEERICDDAYEKGFADGEVAGNVDGYHLGFHRGADIGSELGYYYGVLGEQKKALASHPERMVKAVDVCLELIDAFPRTNDEHVDIFAEIDKIRASYRKACALLKISSKYPGASKLSF